jgi:hypothetical protein
MSRFHALSELSSLCLDEHYYYTVMVRRLNKYDLFLRIRVPTTLATTLDIEQLFGHECSNSSKSCSFKMFKKMSKKMVKKS